MPGIATIHQFLHDAHVPYSVLPHWPAYTAQQEAEATHVPEEDWAKVVVCFIDGEPVEVVVPASSYVNLERLLPCQHRPSGASPFWNRAGRCRELP